MKDFVRLREREKPIVGDEVEVLLKGSRAALTGKTRGASLLSPCVRPLRTRWRYDLRGITIYTLHTDSLKCGANVEGGEQLTELGELSADL